MDIEHGLSGRIRFDNGKRTDFKLDLVELSQMGLRNASASDFEKTSHRYIIHCRILGVSLECYIWIVNVC